MGVSGIGGGRLWPAGWPGGISGAGRGDLSASGTAAGRAPGVGSARVGGAGLPTVGSPAAGGLHDLGGTGGVLPFSEWLKQSLARVSAAEHEAQAAGLALAAGEDVELHQVMLATEKANLMLQLTLQVRNKVLEAYQEIMRLQV